jgi:hypothetical protein
MRFNTSTAQVISKQVCTTAGKEINSLIRIMGWKTQNDKMMGKFLKKVGQ